MTKNGSYIVSTNSADSTVSIAESLRANASVREYKVTADQLRRAKDCLFHKVTIEIEGDLLLGFTSENTTRPGAKPRAAWYNRITPQEAHIMIIKKPSLNQLLEHIRTIAPHATIDEDCDGQLIIHTGLSQNPECPENDNIPLLAFDPDITAP